MEVLAEPHSKDESSRALDHPDEVVVSVGLHDIAERDVVEKERDAAHLEPLGAELPHTQLLGTPLLTKRRTDHEVGPVAPDRRVMDRVHTLRLHGRHHGGGHGPR